MLDEFTQYIKDRKVVIPEGVTLIPDNAFYTDDTDQRGLQITDVIIPNSVETIGRFAFYGCTSLVQIDIPDSVIHIGVSAFELCIGLREIKLPTFLNEISSGSFSWCVNIRFLRIPENVKMIHEGAFQGCVKLLNIEFPHSLTFIGKEAFKQCCSLQEIFITENVRQIEDFAFSGCSSVREIRIPNIIQDCFWLSSKFESLQRVSVYNTKNNALFSGLYSEGNCILKQIGSEKVLIKATQGSIIPQGTTKIANYAFLGAKQILSIDLPEGIKDIGLDAFAGCINLTQIGLPTSLVNISSGAFSGCRSLKSFNIPKNCSSLGIALFSGCSKLSSIVVDDDNPYFLSENNCVLTKDKRVLVLGCSHSVIPEGVERIGDFSFSGCNTLDAIDIPNTVRTIGMSAFRGCVELEYIYLPDSVVNIERSAFADCTRLSSIRISHSLSCLKDELFCGCNSLYEVFIPASVTNVNFRALLAPNLRRVYLLHANTERIQFHEYSLPDKDVFLLVPMEEFHHYSHNSAFDMFTDVVPIKPYEWALCYRQFLLEGL